MISHKDNIEHPGIRECQLTGGYETPEEVFYHCPICGEELADNYEVYQCGPEIVGCEFCVTKKETWEVEDVLKEIADLKMAKQVIGG